MNGNVKKDWWSPFRVGLFSDRSGKHYKRMGMAIWLYGFLHQHAHRETGRLVRKYETIHEETGIPLRNIQRMMKKLEELKYIEVVRLSHCLSIQITKWRPISDKKSSAISGDSHKESSAINGSVIRHKCRGDSPLMTRSAISGESVNDSKIKGNNGSSATSDGSKESIKESIKEINKGGDDWETCFEEDWTDYPVKNGANKPKAKSCYKKTVANDLKNNRPRFQQKTKAYIEDCKASKRFIKNGETWFRNWESIELGPSISTSESPFDDPETKRNNELVRQQMDELREVQA